MNYFLQLFSYCQYFQLTTISVIHQGILSNFKMSDSKVQITLEVSEQQKRDILYFIQSKGWNVDELLVKEEELQGSSSASPNEGDIPYG